MHGIVHGIMNDSVDGIMLGMPMWYRAHGTVHYILPYMLPDTHLPW